MSQYIPKTAWKLNNLAKTYGKGHLGLINQKSPVPSFFASTTQPNKFVFDSEGFNSKHYTKEALLEKYKHKSVSFLDLRDDVEHRVEPLSRAIPMHHHDLLSGAAKYVLPQNKEAEIFVVASSRQRAVNGFNALKRWGYNNVAVADYAALKAAKCD